MNEARNVLSRRTLMRAVVVAGILGVGILSVHALEAVMHATFDKPPAPLRKPFSEMAPMLGRPVHYVSEQADELLDEATVETLGTSDYLMRAYTDKTQKPTAAGSTMHLNVNYYATGSSTPHVPENCWRANGKVEVGDSRRFFDVPVKRKDGSRLALRMQMISFLPGEGQPTKSESGEPLYENVAYVFHVNGKYVANAQEVTSQFWKASYLYAYHCKIEVTPMELNPLDPDHKALRVSATTQKDAQRMISDFIQVALPEVEECLPDPVILTAPQGVSGNNTGKDKR